MTPDTQHKIVMGLMLVTIITLIVLFFANGAEWEDAWLYAFGILIVIIPGLEIYFKRKKDK